VVSGSNVYAGGFASTASAANTAGYWLNGSWNGLTSPAGVSSMVVSGSNVYAGGSYMNSSDKQIAGYWVINGGSATLVSLTNPYGSSLAQVNSMAVSGSNVYAGGYCLNSSWVAGYWMNGSWNGFTNPYGSYNAVVNSMVVSGSNVYAGGYCDYNSSGTLYLAGYWVTNSGGSAWVLLTNTYGSYSAVVNSMVVSGSNVYAGGYCANNSGVWVAGYWVTNGGGTFWVPLTNPYGSYNAVVTSLVVSGSNVYAGGSCNNSSNSQAGYWLNGSWNGLTNPNGSYAAVNSLVLASQ